MVDKGHLVLLLAIDVSKPSLDLKITNKFVLNTNIRFNTTLDKSSEQVGYKKANPILFMIGTNFEF